MGDLGEPLAPHPSLRSHIRFAQWSSLLAAPPSTLWGRIDISEHNQAAIVARCPGLDVLEAPKEYLPLRNIGRFCDVLVDPYYPPNLRCKGSFDLEVEKSTSYCRDPLRFRDVGRAVRAYLLSVRGE